MLRDAGRAALLADAILDHAVAVGVLARRVVVHQLRNKKAHPAMVATKRSASSAPSRPTPRSRARRAWPPTATSAATRRARRRNRRTRMTTSSSTIATRTSSRVRRVLAFLGYGFIYKRNVGYEFLDLTLSNFRTRAFERRALVTGGELRTRPRARAARAHAVARSAAFYFFR